MNSFLVFIYFTCFAVLAGSAFAMMYANIRSIQLDMSRPKPPRHPEAPMPGEEVMYVDVSSDTASEFEARKKKLEDLYNDN